MRSMLYRPESKNSTQLASTAGFSVAEHEIPLSSASKRPRFHHVWLARRGVYVR